MATTPKLSTQPCDFGTEADCPLDLSHALIMSFVQGLEDAAASRGGMLDVATLRARAESFLDQHRTATRAPMFCARLHSALLWDDRRRHPFERLLVKRFAHLLPARSGDDGVREGAILSRRLIPGLMVAVVTMIGLDVYHDVEDRVGAHVRDLRAEGALPVDWDTLARHPDIAGMMDDVLAAMATHFQDFDKRIQWLVSVVNSHLGPTPPEDGSMVWAMGPGKAVKLVGALYADLRHRDRADPRALEAHLGGPAMTALRALFDTLANAEGRLGLSSS